MENNRPHGPFRVSVNGTKTPRGARRWLLYRADERRTTFLISLDVDEEEREKTVAEVVKPDKGLHVVRARTRRSYDVSLPCRFANLSKTEERR